MLACFAALNCGNRDKNNAAVKYRNPCPGVNKVDLLIQNIAINSKTYLILPGDTSRFICLVAKSMKAPRKVYPGVKGCTFNTTSNDDANKRRINTMMIDSVKFDLDSANVTLMTLFYLRYSYVSGSVVGSHVKYTFDTTSCNWRIIEEKLEMY